MRNKTMLVLAGLSLLGTVAVAAEPAAPKAAAPASAPAAPKAPPAAHPTGAEPAAHAHAAGAAPAAAPSAAPAADAAPKIDWAKMKFAERKKYMKTAVMPEMKKVFAAYEPKRYSKVTCGTCHGKGADNGKFKMPNPELPKLPGPTDRAGFMALAEKKPEAVKFMGGQVKPKMAALLGLAEWTPATPTGFACYQCHTHEEGPAAGAKEAPTGEAPKAAPPAPTPGAAKAAPTTPAAAAPAPAKAAPTAPAKAPAAEPKGW